MSCTNPNLIIPIKEKQSNGTDIGYKFLGNYRRLLEKGFKFLPTTCDDGEVLEPILAPCGKCLSCQKKVAFDWAKRLELEYQLYSDNECWFLTFTYDDHFLPHTDDTYVPTLYPRDMEKFIDNFRKSNGPFRYFYCGEYGSRTMRPHYHMIIFGVKDIPDLKVYSKSNGNVLYTSDIINKKWRRGNVIIGNVSPASINYVASYVTKKGHYPDDPNIVKPFRRMSRNPGIGAQKLLNKELLEYGEHLYTSDGNTFDIPRYYAKKLCEEYPREFYLWKQRKEEVVRRLATAAKQSSGLSEFENLQNSEISAFEREKINALKKGVSDL